MAQQKAAIVYLHQHRKMVWHCAEPTNMIHSVEPHRVGQGSHGPSKAKPAEGVERNSAPPVTTCPNKAKAGGADWTLGSNVKENNV